MDNKFWIAIIVLLSVNLATSNPVNAEALIDVEISRGINSKRQWGTSEIELGYTWQFENRHYTALIAIDSQQYNKKRNQRQRRRYNTRQFLPPMVYEGAKALQELVREFDRVMPRNWEPERKINFVLAFVHAIPWTDDETTGYREFYKYPVETLVESKGDCEDTSMLFASILSGLGFELALIDLPKHIAVGVKGNFQGTFFPYGNNRYYYCETTATGYKLGRLPKDYQGVAANLILITPNPVRPRKVMPTVPRMPREPALPTPLEYFQQGINLYEGARYNEAIKALRLALRGLRNPKRRAETYIHLGAAELGFGKDISETKTRFQEALRQNPDQELPWRGHPKFEPLIKEVRRESIGELTVSASPTQTEIWIYSDEIKRKKLGYGTTPINIRLFKGKYTVEGIYAGRSTKRTFNIKPNTRRALNIKIPPLRVVVDDTPPNIELVDPIQTANINQQIEVMAEVTDNRGVKSVSLFYGFSHSRTSQPSKYYRRALTNISNIYFGDIPSQSEAGYIWYYLTAMDGAGNRSELKQRVVEIKSKRIKIPRADNQPPTIELRSPPRVARVNQRILVKAWVTDNVGVKSVSLFYGFSHSRTSQPSKYYRRALTKTTVGIYAEYMPPQSETGYVWYYFGATDREGNENRSEKRAVKIESGRQDRPKSPSFPKASITLQHQGIWLNYAWSNDVFQGGASHSDRNTGDSISFTYLREGKNHQTFGAQLDYSYQRLSNMSAIFQWGPALGGSPIIPTFLGGVARYNDFDSTRTRTALNRQIPDEPTYMTPILGLGLKLYPLNRVSIDAMWSFKLPSNVDMTYLYHYELGARIYINESLNLKIGYSQFDLGGGNLERTQIGLGFTF